MSDDNAKFNSDQPEEQISMTQNTTTASGGWNPRIGTTCQQLGQYLEATGALPKGAFRQVRESSLSILSKTAPPTEVDSRRTGLVVGYVQSGKTMSMTTVAALARDNGFRVVIVLAGVTTNLLTQSSRRFTDYLQGSARGQSWAMLDAGGGAKVDSHLHTLQDMLSIWRDARVAEADQQTLFITVLKHYGALEGVADLLGRVDLRGIPALIIDDEADQASLNTKPKENVHSTTHAAIEKVRSTLSNHSYLQYTATPQAPLLITLVDLLAPEFVEVINTGDQYTGGKAFFQDNQGLVARIPSKDISEKNDEPPLEPPPSLHEAMRLFFVGAAIGLHEGASGKRSMLVHPSERKDDHDRFFGWVKKAKQRWSHVMTLEEGDPDREELIGDMHTAYRALEETIEHLPPFDAVIEKLRLTLSRTVITKVNSEEGTEVNWNNAYEHILVGGQKLNRGYTVEGLTVTYMPRGPGGWNADTIQQRARFFGYKRSYLGFCRVYLHQDVEQAYRNYVVHEEHMRDSLSAWGNKALKDWKRAFLLNSQFQATRRNVLKDPRFSVKKKKSWHYHVQPYHEAIRKHNFELVSAYTQNLEWTNFSEDHQNVFRHEGAIVSLNDLYENFLVHYRTFNDDDQTWLWAVQVWVEAIKCDRGDAECRLIRMDSHPERQRLLGKKTRQRQINPITGIVTLPQGRDKDDASGKYPGDAKMFDTDRVTIQIHQLSLGPQGQPPDVIDVVAIATHIPKDLLPDDVLVQLRPNP